MLILANLERDSDDRRLCLVQMFIDRYLHTYE